MYAIMEKIPVTNGQTDGYHNDREITYHHLKVVGKFQNQAPAEESVKIWSDVLGWYNRERLTVKPIPGYIETGQVLNLHDQELARLNLDKGFTTIRGGTRPFDRSNTIRDESIRVKFRKEGSNLLADRYEIAPEKGIVNIYYRTYQETTQDYDRVLVARVDGYASTKGISRAKREVQYLIDEPDEQGHRVFSGMFPVITPEGIVLSRMVRPEAPIFSEGCEA